jgi:predicted O-methyltransferase YrrM
LRALFKLALACPKGARALEIGSHLGASTCYIAAGLAQVNGHLYCVDTWHNETMPEGEQDTLPEFKRNTAGLDGVITPLRKRSDQVAQDELSLPLHLVFLDGDHSYVCTKADFERVAPWVAPEGVVAFHDVIWFEGVSRVIGEALAGREWMVAGHVANLMWLKRAQWKQ